MATASFQNFHDLEKDFFSRIRNGVKTTEDINDLHRFFASTVSELLENAYSDELTITEDDVAFKPQQEDHFELSSRLHASQDFMRTWSNSSLPHVIKKAADTTYHRYIHLNKHQEKTEKKIRH